MNKKKFEKSFKGLAYQDFSLHGKAGESVRKGSAMNNPKDELQKERDELGKILAELVISTDNWVGFFPERRIQKAYDAIRSWISRQLPEPESMDGFAEDYKLGHNDCLEQVKSNLLGGER